MGGVLGVVLTDGSGLDDHSRQRELFDTGNEIDIHALGKDIGSPGDLTGTQVQLIQQSGDGPGICRVHVSDIQVGHRLPGCLRRLLVHSALACDFKAGAHFTKQLPGGRK